MEKIEKLVEIFKALSDPTRLKLVKALNDCEPGVCQGGSLCVNALAHRLNVTQSLSTKLHSGKRWGKISP